MSQSLLFINPSKNVPATVPVKMNFGIIYTYLQQSSKKVQMKSSIIYTVIYNRKNKLNANGKALVQIRAQQDGKTRYFGTDIYLTPKQWNAKSRKVRNTHPNSFIYNQKIRDIVEAMEAYEIKMINRHGELPLSRLHEYSTSGNDQAPNSFTEFFALELVNNPMKPGSHKMYVQTLNKLRAFRRTVYFEDLSYSFVHEFNQFLLKKKLSLNTIKKHHARLKTFILLAIRKDYLEANRNPYTKFRPKSETPQRVYLTDDELKSLESLQIPRDKTHLRFVLDIFLFQCYTGMRHSDVSRICRKHLHTNSRGTTYLEIQSKKSGKQINLPLHILFPTEMGDSRPVNIIHKYMDRLPADESFDEVELLKLSLQYYNRALKNIASLAGINKKLASHVARRTFATEMAKKVKPSILQRLLQHSKLDMTNIYIQLSSDAVERELEKVSWKG